MQIWGNKLNGDQRYNYTYGPRIAYDGNADLNQQNYCGPYFRIRFVKYHVMFPVILSLQICEDVLSSLRAGQFGSCDDTKINGYMSHAHSLFPLHRAFTAPSLTNSTDADAAGDNNAAEPTSSPVLPNGDASS